MTEAPILEIKPDNRLSTGVMFVLPLLACGLLAVDQLGHALAVLFAAFFLFLGLVLAEALTQNIQLDPDGVKVRSAFRRGFLRYEEIKSIQLLRGYRGGYSLSIVGASSRLAVSSPAFTYETLVRVRRLLLDRAPAAEDTTPKPAQMSLGRRRTRSAPLDLSS